MAGLLPSFLSSAQLEIHVGDDVLAYAQSLSFQDNMTNVPVGGIGAYSFHALEPVAYAGSGSLVITHYSKKVHDAIKSMPSDLGTMPSNVLANGIVSTPDTSPEQYRDGNSLLVSEFFNPVNLIMSRTFDVNIYERMVTRTANKLGLTVPVTSTTSGNTLPGPMYTLKNCRMTSFRLSFTPGSLVQQIVTFICMAVLDNQTDDGPNKASPITPVVP